MRTIALYEMLFGILTIIGGISGTMSTDLWEPLAAGLVAGVVLIGGALKMQKGARSGIYTTLVVSLLLLGYAILRIMEDDAFMPGGVMAIVAGISTLLLLALLVQPKERRRIF
jgi:uncharacterized membrane protein (UPF0136 family)